MHSVWKKRCKYLLALLTLLIGLWLVFFYLPALVYYVLQQQKAPVSGAFGLGDYEVTVEAKAVQGIRQNLSGLTFHPESKTLFGIANGPSRVVEMTTDGEVLRVIRVRGGKDTEGIAHLHHDEFMIVDEKTNALWQVEIAKDTKVIHLDDAPHAQLSLDPSHKNLGVEALAWNAQDKTLWVGQEKWPMRVMEIAGELPVADGPAGKEKIKLHAQREWEAQGAMGWLLSDLASITNLNNSSNMLFLGQESGVVVEYTRDGDAVGILPLWRGMHGLRHGIAQAEGIAVDDQSHMYLVAEPNLFYRFEKRRAVP